MPPRCFTCKAPNTECISYELRFPLYLNDIPRFKLFFAANFNFLL